VLTLGADENRFHPDRLTKINAALDEVEAAEGAKAVVTTGVGKFYSNGLDLDFMAANPDASKANLVDVHSLFARVLAFSAPIVAAVQGHAFAAGAMLALAHDPDRHASGSRLLLSARGLPGNSIHRGHEFTDPLTAADRHGSRGDDDGTPLRGRGRTAGRHRRRHRRRG
jgi:hypothetical protein